MRIWGVGLCVVMELWLSFTRVLLAACVPSYLGSGEVDLVPGLRGE